MRDLLLFFFMISYLSDISAQTFEPFSGVPPVYLATPFSKNIVGSKTKKTEKKKKYILFFLDGATTQFYNLNDELDANFFMQGVSARLHILSKTKLNTELGVNYYIPVPYKTSINNVDIREGLETNYGFHIIENYFFKFKKELFYLSQGIVLQLQKLNFGSGANSLYNSKSTSTYYSLGIGAHFHKAFFFEARYLYDFNNGKAIMLNMGYRLKVKIRIRK